MGEQPEVGVQGALHWLPHPLNPIQITSHPSTNPTTTPLPSPLRDDASRTVGVGRACKDTSLGSLLVHDAISTLPAADGVARPDLILAVALCKDTNEDFK